ncbi:MAG: segregation/condensation protein A [Armatimonadetes bacterium]|nr:segregation/condensation protein A [Armatimonadota bacterium]
MFRKPQGSVTGYQVQLPQYEGPLDLLLELVGRLRLDITEISLAQVAGQYQAYLESLHELNVEIESSYVVVFAQLLEIKSRVLLPEPPPPEEPESSQQEEEGSGADLVERLKTYKAFKEMAEWLGEREASSSARYPHPCELPEPDIPALELSLASLAAAMSRLDRSTRAPRPPVEVKRVEISVPQRAQQIWQWLTSRPRALFRELLGKKPSRGLIVVTFLALLELARREQVRLRQERFGDEIEVTRKENP